jgi:hypothetical protein
MLTHCFIADLQRRILLPGYMPLGGYWARQQNATLCIVGLTQNETITAFSKVILTYYFYSLFMPQLFPSVHNAPFCRLACRHFSDIPKPSVPPQRCVVCPPGFSSYIKQSVVSPTVRKVIHFSQIP